MSQFESCLCLLVRGLIGRNRESLLDKKESNEAESSNSYKAKCAKLGHRDKPFKMNSPKCLGLRKLFSKGWGWGRVLCGERPQPKDHDQAFSCPQG